MQPLSGGWKSLQKKGWAVGKLASLVPFVSKDSQSEYEEEEEEDDTDDEENHRRLRSLRFNFTTGDVVAPLLTKRGAGGADSRRNTGTFMAMLTILETMWGVVIFLKFGWVVGKVGLPWALVALTISFVHQLLGAGSVSAVATNNRNYTGTIAMLSHNLGGAVGITVGTLYYVGLVALAAVELAGAVQVIDAFLDSLGHHTIFGSDYTDQIALAVPTLAVLGLVRLYAPHFVHVLSWIVFGIFVIGLGSCVAGLWLTGLAQENLNANIAKSNDCTWAEFAACLTFVYPCFLGLFGAANKQSQLKDPERSIPIATFSAPTCSALLYAGLMVLMSMTATPDVLLRQETFFLSVALPIPAVGYIGAIIVGLGSCLSCIDVAPWILRAIACEESAPDSLRPLDGLDGHGEPRKAVVVTLLLSVPFLFVPSLEAIATMTSVSFLAMYCSMHVACGLASLLNLPSWRPRFNVLSWRLSLLGLFMSIGMAVTISLWLTGVIFGGALLIVAFAEYLLDSKQFNTHVGIRGLKYKIAMSLLASGDGGALDSNGLQAADVEADHWRPQILCYFGGVDGLADSSGSKKTRRSQTIMDMEQGKHGQELLRFVEQLKATGGGLVIVAVTLKVHQSALGALSCQQGLDGADKESVSAIRGRTQAELQGMMDEAGLQGFAEVVVANQRIQAEATLLQATGLGSLRPNSVMLSWPNAQMISNASSTLRWMGFGDSKEGGSEEESRCLVSFMAECAVQGKAIIALKLAEGVSMKLPRMQYTSRLKNYYAQREGGFIDLWWIYHDGDLLLLLAHLLLRHENWARCRLRIFTLASHKADAAELERDIEHSLRIHHRISVAQVKVIVKDQLRSAWTLEQRVDWLHDQLSETSKESQLVILNLPELDATAAQDPTMYVSMVNRMTACLRRCILVRASLRDTAAEDRTPAASEASPVASAAATSQPSSPRKGMLKSFTMALGPLSDSEEE